jgi:hypothetical protein
MQQHYESFPHEANDSYKSSKSGHNVCSQCGKTYKHMRNLDRHQKVECNKPRRYCCIYCPYRTKHKSDAMKHVVRVHKGRKNEFYFDDN